MFSKSKDGRAGRASAKPRRRGIRLAPRAIEGLERRDLMAAGPLGINLSGIDYVDLMKETIGGWVSTSSKPLVKDAHGWPEGDASILVLDQRVNQPWNGPDPNAVQPDIGGDLPRQLPRQGDRRPAELAGHLQGPEPGV